MRLTRTQKLTLYSLGECYRTLNMRFEDKPLEVFISKVAFIDFLMGSGLAGKKERAMYRNLEDLERKKLILYNDKNLTFTQKGYTNYNRIRKEVKPFLDLHEVWQDASFTKKVQTRIKNES